MLNDEIIGMCRQFCKGINTEEEYLALDLIDKQGPGGEYFTTDHTYKHWREWFLPNLQDRSDWETWVDNGRKSMTERINERTQNLLDTYETDPIPEDLYKEIKGIVDAADARHAG